MHDLPLRTQSKYTFPPPTHTHALVRPGVDTSARGRIIYDDCLLGSNAAV